MAEIETAIRRESANTVSWGSIFRSRGNLRRLRIIIGIACECLCSMPSLDRWSMLTLNILLYIQSFRSGLATASSPTT
jgi:hypothetical protein